jgi:predicted helicase
MVHLLGGSNVALCANRQVNSQYRHVGVTRGLVTDCTLSTATKERTYVFPLYLAEDGNSLFQGESRRQNIGSSILDQIARKFGLQRDAPYTCPTGITPENIFHYFFALLHSPGYRSRYSDFLRADFPRLPLTGELGLFHKLAGLGGELAALHLMESPKLDNFITTYSGPKSPEVRRVDWSDGTVWLDAAAVKRNQAATHGTIGFRGVPEAVWNFHIGGYQVCEKWLKDRKGRTLSKDDIIHYQKIVVALNQTIRLMKQIDEVFERHGGWPGAFV